MDKAEEAADEGGSISDGGADGSGLSTSATTGMSGSMSGASDSGSLTSGNDTTSNPTTSDPDSSGDPGNCPGQEPGCVVDWAGAFGAPGTADGIGGAARFNFIAGLTSVGDFVYVADNHAIRRVHVDTADVATWAGATGTPAHVNDVGTTARFDNPVGLTTNGNNIWVADAGNFVIRRIIIATGQTSTIAGAPGQSGSIDGGDTARFENMRDLIYDGGQNLYLVQSNGLIRRINIESGIVTTVAGLANADAFADGTGTAARFFAPRFIEVVGDDEFVIGDTENHRPRVMTVAGDMGTVSSPWGMAQGYADGGGNAARFDRLRGLAYDDGVLAVADSDNFVLREIDLATAEVTTLAGMATSPTHLVGVYLAAGFDKPLDMHFDPGSGDLFISEGPVLRRMYYK